MENQVDSLNKILQGEHMAVNSYNILINRAGENNVKNILKSIQQDHRNHAQSIAARIHDIGGIPDENIGIKGAISNNMLKLRTRNMKTADVVKKAFDGEDKGIARVEKELTGLDSDNTNIINNNLSVDHDHLKQLQDIISQYEIQ